MVGVQSFLTDNTHTHTHNAASQHCCWVCKSGSREWECILRSNQCRSPSLNWQLSVNPGGEKPEPQHLMTVCCHKLRISATHSSSSINCTATLAKTWNISKKKTIPQSNLLIIAHAATLLSPIKSRDEQTKQDKLITVKLLIYAHISELQAKSF